MHGEAATLRAAMRVAASPASPALSPSARGRSLRRGSPALASGPRASRRGQASVAGSNVPENSSSTGPVIQTWSSASPFDDERAAGQRHRHRACRCSFLRTAETAAAQAAVPQALVSPTPRSQVRDRDRVAAP